MKAIEKKTKICKRCKQRKSTTKFYKQQQKSDDGKITYFYYDSLCVDCRIQYGIDRRRKIKRQAIQFLGGKCVDCGTNEDAPEIFDFHHINGTKEFSIGKQTKAFESLKDELQKCILLCANCHRKRHNANIAFKERSPVNREC